MVTDASKTDPSQVIPSIVFGTIKPPRTFEMATFVAVVMAELDKVAPASNCNVVLVSSAKIVVMRGDTM